MATSSARIRDIPKVDIRGAFVRRVDLTDAILRGANLSDADATGALFRGADFAEARLARTILRGADLTGAINLTAGQLAEAIIDDDTRLPAGIDRAEVVRLASQTPAPTVANHR